MMKSNVKLCVINLGLHGNWEENKILTTVVCEIWGSHCGAYAHASLLGCYAVSTDKWLPTFYRNMLPPSSVYSSPRRI